MSEHTPTPWKYRPHEYDDWGWIRGPKQADGLIPLAALARGASDHKTFDDHRRAGTDPYAANAAFIVKAVNSHDDLVAALKLARARIEYLGAVCHDPRHFQNNADVVLPKIDAILASIPTPQHPGDK